MFTIKTAKKSLKILDLVNCFICSNSLLEILAKRSLNNLNNLLSMSLFVGKICKNGENLLSANFLFDLKKNRACPFKFICL